SGPLNPSRGGGIQVPFSGGGPGPMVAPVGSYVVEEVLVQDGDVVKQGQVIAKLRGPELETKVKTLTEELEADRKTLADLLGVRPEMVSRVDPANGITLRAPISGRVVGLTATEGTEMKQGQIIARVVDDSRFRVVAKLTPRVLFRSWVGQRVVLSFPQFDGFIEAKVIEVNPTPIPESSSSLETGKSPGNASDNEQYALVHRVTLEGKNAGLIRSGMQARVGLIPNSDGGSDGGGAVTEANFVRYPGKVTGYVSEERVLNQADAIATRVFVQDMQTVEAGDPLVSLSGQDAREMIQKKVDKLREKEATLRQTLSQLELLEVRSPMDGVVAEFHKSPGQTAQPGEWMGSVFNTSDMRMWVQVDDADVLLVQQGAPVQVTVDALPGKTFEGKVNRVNTMGKDDKGITRFSVDIQVKGTPELRPGMQAKAHIDAGSAKGVLLAPVEAIFEEDGKPKVEVLGSDGSTKTVAVELGLMNDRLAEVKKGLQEGDQVITGSTADLLPSQRLQSRDSLLPGKDKDQGDQKNNSGGGSTGGSSGGSSGGNKTEPAPSKR
ncbi:MAG: efflux RND transporter periplasmic adaptor subunit, partial [Actinobacteria bacterium]|nr:efflux RND transporter periplasmic adaptor subunit [Actinomycetota bacterium]